MISGRRLEHVVRYTLSWFATRWTALTCRQSSPAALVAAGSSVRVGVSVGVGGSVGVHKFACLAFLLLAENERLQEEDTLMTLDLRTKQCSIRWRAVSG